MTAQFVVDPDSYAALIEPPLPDDPSLSLSLSLLTGRREPMTATESLPLICTCGHPRRLHDDIGCDASLCDCSEFRDGIRPSHVPPARPHGETLLPRPSAPAARPQAQGQRPTPPPPLSPRDVNDPRVLIAAAKRSDNRRIFVIGHRVEADLARLLELVREERAKAEEKELADRQAAEARAEIARLEAQLAAAKAKLRAKPAAVTATKGAAAGENRKSVPCPVVGCERTFESTQAVAMHRRRAHEGFDPHAAKAD